MFQLHEQNAFEAGLDTWLVATGQVPAPEGGDGVLRSMAVVLLGEEWLEPETAQRLLPIGPWASRDEALRDGPALARLRDMTFAEKSDLRRALFGARKYLARCEGQEVEERDPREWLFAAALENVQRYLLSKGWEVELTEDHTAVEGSDAAFRTIVETVHPKKEGPILRFIVSARHVAKSGTGLTATPDIDGGCVSCVRANGCEQLCPFYGRSFCQLHIIGLGRVDDRGFLQHTLGLGQVDF